MGISVLTLWVYWTREHQSSCVGLLDTRTSVLTVWVYWTREHQSSCVGLLDTRTSVLMCGSAGHGNLSPPCVGLLETRTSLLTVWVCCSWRPLTFSLPGSPEVVLKNSRLEEVMIKLDSLNSNKEYKGSYTVPEPGNTSSHSLYVKAVTLYPSQVIHPLTPNI